MAWTITLPSQGAAPPWGDVLDAAIVEIRTHIETLEANGTPVTGVTSLTVAGTSGVTGDVDLDAVYAELAHFHAGSDITSGTIAVGRLPTSDPIVVIKAKGGFGASAGNWPANRAAVTSDASRQIIYLGNSDPGTGLMNNDVDLYLITS